MSVYRLSELFLSKKRDGSKCEIGIRSRAIKDVEGGSAIPLEKATIKLFRNEETRPFHTDKTDSDGFIRHSVPVKLTSKYQEISITAVLETKEGATDPNPITKTITLPPLSLPKSDRKDRTHSAHQPGSGKPPRADNNPSFVPDFNVVLRRTDVDKYEPSLSVLLTDRGNPVQGKEVTYFSGGRPIPIDVSEKTDKDGISRLVLDDYEARDDSYLLEFSARVKIDDTTSLSTSRKQITIPAKSRFLLDFPTPQSEEVDESISCLILQAILKRFDPEIGPDGRVTGHKEIEIANEDVSFLDGTTELAKGSTDNRGEAIRKCEIKAEARPKTLYIQAKATTRAGDGDYVSSNTRIVTIPAAKASKPATEGKGSEAPKGPRWKTIAYDLSLPEEKDVKLREVGKDQYLIPLFVILNPIEEDQERRRNDKPTPVRGQQIVWHKEGEEKPVAFTTTNFRGKSGFDFGPFEAKEDVEYSVKFIATTTIDGKEYTSDHLTVWIPKKAAPPKVETAAPAPEPKLNIAIKEFNKDSEWVTVRVATTVDGKPGSVKFYARLAKGSILAARLAGTEEWKKDSRIDFDSDANGRAVIEVRLVKLSRGTGGDTLVCGIADRDQDYETTSGDMYLSGKTYLPKDGRGEESSSSETKH